MGTMEREMDWNDVIEKEGDEYILLPEGDYNFVVESFDRARHAGSEKLPPCNKAVLRLKIDSAEGTAFITHNLFLHTKTEGLLSAFFTCIGQKKKASRLRWTGTKSQGHAGAQK